MRKNSPARGLLAISALMIGFLVPQAHATNRIWSGTGADGYWGTAGNWGGTAPVNGDTLTFTGTTQQNSTNNIGSLSINWLDLVNNGFTLNGANLLALNGPLTNNAGTNILALSLNISASNPGWNIAAGSELRFTGPFTNTTTVNPLATMGGGGTVRITSSSFLPNRFFTLTNGTIIIDGGTASTGDGFRLQPGAGYKAVFQLTNNGSLTLSGGPNLRLCQTATGGSSEVDMSSGLLNLDVTSGLGSGDLFIGEAANTTTVFNHNGGLVEFTGNGDNRVAFANASSSANGTYNLNGGTLWTAQIAQVNAGSPGGTFNFNGGTLKALVSSATFFQGVNAANILSGGAVIDTTNLNVTIGESLPGAGGLTKLGTGTLTLTGNNTYSGGTVVSNGDLAVTTASTGGGGYTVEDGAELDVKVTSANTSLASSSLTLGLSGNVINDYILGANASTTVPASVVSGALNLNGTVTVNVTGAISTPATYVLMSYGSISGSGAFISGSLPLIVGYVATVTNNTAANQLQLVYSLAPQAVKWGTGDGSWDTTSLNWETLADAGPTNYVEGAPVVFDDSASGSSPITVTLSGNRSPGSITNASSADLYTIAGDANILGALLTVNGGSTNTFIIDNGSGNTFSAIAINSGALQLGNSDTNGSLGSSAIADNGALILDRTDNLSLGSSITGTGSLVQNGSGSVTLSVSNSYAGTTTINAGTIVMGNTYALSTNTIEITNNGTLDINGNMADASSLQPVIVSGSGVGGNGAIINSGVLQNNAFRNVVLAGNTTVGGSGLIGLRTSANTDPGLVANGYSLTKVGTNQFNLNGGTTTAGITNTWFTDLGNIDIQQGILSFERHAALGNPTNTISVESGGTLQVFSLNPTNVVPTNSIVLNGGTLQGTAGTVGDTNTLAGQVTLNGPTNYINTVAGAYLILDGPISGAGSVDFAGTDCLGGVNTYSGDSVITGGTVQLLATGSIADSTNVILEAGALLDVSAVSPWTLEAGQTLSGVGTVHGSVLAAGTLAPGNGTGTLAINGDLTLAGNVTIEVNTSLAQSNDLATVTGSLDNTGAGTVEVTNLGPALVVGDTFKLFNQPVANGGALTVTGSGVTWVNHLAVDGTISVIQPVSTNAVTMTNVFAGGNLSLSWPADHIGWRLQVQTNSLSAGLGTDWSTWSGSTNVDNVTIPVDPGSPAVFFRLVYP